ncbi:MAG: Arc family DNA binding domain-containing protein [Candidatus Hydrogenedentes bacterium]|nr:Arc family DNA binding domain-containing protein [Candidatus Hydrogenedentota bacterium]
MAERKSYLLRLSPDLWEELNRWAKDDLRSINAQIEYLLREAVRARRRKTFSSSEDDQGD